MDGWKGKEVISCEYYHSTLTYCTGIKYCTSRCQSYILAVLKLHRCGAGKEGGETGGETSGHPFS